MPDKSVRWLRVALQDLHELMAHLEANADRETAEDVASRIWKAGKSLCVLSSRGRHGKLPGTRELVLSDAPYYISYRVGETEVQILRIVHFARHHSQQ